MEIPPMCLPPGMHVAADRSERPRCGGNEARTGGATHATIEDCTTRRDEAAKKNRRLIEAVGGKRRIRLQERAEVPPRRHILGGSVTLNIGKSGLVCSR